MQKENCYFAAGNTTNGFISYYNDIFDNLDSVYIIKGGSGTGKSRMMKELGEAGKEKNKNIEYFYCSFDPSSLDGIIIDSKIAVIDGTAPHIHEPKVPGAKDNLIDVGQFWNCDMLYGNKKAISELGNEKRFCFEMAYIYLESAGKIIESSRKISKKCILKHNYGCCAAGGLWQKCNDPRVRIRSAFGKNGIATFDSYSFIGETNVKISDEFKTFCVGTCLKEIMTSGDSRLDAVMISFDPLEKNIPDAIFTSKGKCIETSESNGDYDICEIMSSNIKEGKNILSENYHMYNELLTNAKLWLQRASLYHFELEKIYISAMDFESKEKYTEKLIDAIMKKL